MLHSVYRLMTSTTSVNALCISELKFGLVLSQVDTVSLFICTVIYLHLGFSSSHGFAYRVPITFGVTLGIMLSMVYVVLYMQDR